MATENRIFLFAYNELTTPQRLAMIRIALNSGLSVIQLKSTDIIPTDNYYFRLEQGWIRVGRGIKMNDTYYNESLYMHPNRMDMDEMTPETVKDLVLPLKEIMASQGAYQAKPLVQHVVVDPTDLNYLMKRLRFDAKEPAEADDGEIVSVEDISIEPVTKKEE
jgi:hypothetical protein